MSYRIEQRRWESHSYADTHRNVLAEVKTFLRWCAKQGYTNGNPAENVEGVGRRKSGKAQLSATDQDAWLTLAIALGHEGDEGAIAALLAFTAGMRATEIRLRRVGDFDERGLLRITKAKTRAGNRLLKIDPEVASMLTELCEGRHRDEPIFYARTSKDGFHHKEWIAAQVRRICDLSGVPWEVGDGDDLERVGAHSMRGALASVAGEAGIPLDVIRKVLGHNPGAAVTKRAYALPGSVEAGEQARGLRLIKGEKA